MEINAEKLIQVLQQTLDLEKTGGAQRNTITPYGINTQMTWTRWKEALANGHFSNVRVKESSLTTSANTLYGCTGLFGLCGPDDIVGLTMNDDPLVEWMGFFPDTVCEKFIKAWVYTDVAGTAAGNISTTVYGDECDNPPTSEKGVCEYYIGDYGTLRACGEAVKVGMLGMRKCDKQPTYTIPVEGVGPIRIDNDLDLETINATQVIKHELSRLLITGDKTVSGQFDGLNQLVKTGYTTIGGDLCTGLDSVVVDWQNDDLSGAVNGHGSIITKIRDVFRRIMWRIAQTGMGKPAEGDVVLVMPTWLAWEVLDEWAVWSFREQVNSTQVVYRDYMDVRSIREKYAVGLFGGGYITIDGFNLHIIPHDWMAISQSAPYHISDIYMLTRRIGTRRVLQGQYMPVNMGADAVNAQVGYSYFNTEAMQGGRMIRWMKFDNTCVQPCALVKPRLYLDAPWAQAVINNVGVSLQFSPQSLDPQSNYFLSNKNVAEKITQYFYGDTGSGDGTWFH